MIVVSRRRWAGLTLAATLSLVTGMVDVLGSGPASAGQYGYWTLISQGEVTSTTEASLARANDGSLRALFTERLAGATGDQLTLVGINGSGASLTRTTVVANYNQAPNPILLNNGSTMTAVTSGLNPQVEGDPHVGRMFELTSSDGGLTWSTQPYSLGQSTQASVNSGTAAIQMADGTTLAGFAQKDGGITWRNERLNQPEVAAPDQTIIQPGCCVSAPNFARQGSDVWAAWQRDTTDNGTYVKKILPVEGPTTHIPKSAKSTLLVGTGRVPIFTRPDGTAYVAFCEEPPTCAIVIYRVSDGKSVTLPSSGATAAAVSVAPDGTIWAVWRYFGRIKAARSGTNDLEFSYPVEVALPTYEGAIDSLSASARSSELVDIVANSSNGMWHTQATKWMIPEYPGYLGDDSGQYANYLRLVFKPRRWVAGKAMRVRALVTAGPDGVDGADVYVAGKRRCTTKKGGECTFRLPALKPGRVRVKALSSGDEPDRYFKVVHRR